MSWMISASAPASCTLLPGQRPRRLELVVAQDGVDGDEDARVITVRVRGQALDVGHGVAGVGAGAEVRPPM